MRRLIDSHVHMESFEDADSIIQQSKDEGIDALICVGGSLASSVFAKKLAGKHPDYVYPALGVHPSEVLKDDIDAAIDYLRENLDGCVAVGEIGLDYAYSFAKPKDVRLKMREIYKRFLGVASEFDLPVSVHSRSAYKDTLNLAVEAGVKGVFHWYDGPVHTLKEILDAGFYVSATPSIEYSKGAKAVMAEAPIERILVETDSPVFLRNFDRKSTPVDVKLVVEALAELKDMSSSEVSAVTARNTETLFNIQ
jgi:TatD DNase family protein